MHMHIFPMLFRIAPPLPDAWSVGKLHVYPAKDKQHIETRMQDEADERARFSTETPP